ncbi:uncharacterized protein BKA55DRAFT_579605 [Fusarium redolens]|uniref:Uncharacterized protein n=1 Tax=Fusarium redolens TaxID=48865 RepID=A0A9P9GBW1_FUSRE|nr:uncharacterized protein BKA55DRAFT_579605 [Fusarium redolens]KAH7234892.1 hypothetical protein BKA55DRAFT_579605 [Fusarium redolens]
MFGHKRSSLGALAVLAVLKTPVNSYRRLPRLLGTKRVIVISSYLIAIPYCRYNDHQKNATNITYPEQHFTCNNTSKQSFQCNSKH